MDNRTRDEDITTSFAVEGQLLLHVRAPFLPPSSNHCYFINKWKRLSLTKQGDAFKKRFIELVVGPNLHIITQLEKYKTAGWLFSVHTVVYLAKTDLLNTTFGQKHGAESRYKKVDAENRLKLISDSFAKAVGIDDSLFFQVTVTKALCEPGEPRIENFLYLADPQSFGFRQEGVMAECPT